MEMHHDVSQCEATHTVHVPVNDVMFVIRRPLQVVCVITITIISLACKNSL